MAAVLNLNIRVGGEGGGVLFSLCNGCFNYDKYGSVLARDTYQETGDPARLPAQLAACGAKGVEVVYGEEKNILYWAD